MRIMINEISKKAGKYLDYAVELLKELIAHKSVAAEAQEGMPYGRDCADCLAFAEDFLKKEGYIVRNFDNHAITADFGGGNAELGILCHLDVVPTDGQKWTSDPFKPEIREGRIYGRGAIDDKGPAAAVITAMKMIKDSGIKVNKNFRLILGSNEENGSTDMEYYTSKESFPPMLFTPDGEFPIISIEKGMIRYDMSCCSDDKNIVSIKGGSVYNAVPETAQAIVAGISEDDIEAAMVKADCDVLFTLEKIDGTDNIRINVEGKGVHASTPEEGRNAVTALISLLSSLDLAEGSVKKALSGLAKYFPYGETDGKSAGLDRSDEKSGALTLVLSRLFLENGTLTAGFDSRFPVSVTGAEVSAKMAAAAADMGMTGKEIIVSEPHCADENSEMVKTLLSVYTDCTGKESKCLAIGGGTYVHDTKNGVAFGAEWSDENHMHGADEFIGLYVLEKDIEIYCEAILRLCTE